MPAHNPLPDISAAAVASLGQLGDYKLLAKLGEGGMGQVYKALHTQLDRVVAVKILPPERLGDEDALRRFKQEVRAVGKLKHPHIVYADDAREIGGTYVLVMEYLEGMNLADLVRKLGPLPVADACELVRQAALGLQCAHEQRLVHRDVKPSNLMLALTSGGRESADVVPHQPAHAGRSPAAAVKLLDLGLARLPVASVAGGSLTSSGMIMGTPDYIAPEQINNSHDVDIRADIYSLGCSFYYLLIGQPPFAAPDHATVYDKLKAHVEQEPPDVRRLRRDVPSGLVDILLRMVAKQPPERFAAPAEVAAALQPFTAGCDLGRLLATAQGAQVPRREPSPAGARRRSRRSVATRAGQPIRLATPSGDRRDPPPHAVVDRGGTGAGGGGRGDGLDRDETIGNRGGGSRRRCGAARRGGPARPVRRNRQRGGQRAQRGLSTCRR